MPTIGNIDHSGMLGVDATSSVVGSGFSRPPVNARRAVCRCDKHGSKLHYVDERLDVQLFDASNTETMI